MISFGSDNHSGIDSRILAAIAEANIDHDFAYGDDTLTLKCERMFNELFGREVKTFFMFNGTGTNVTILKSITQSFNSIICAVTAHIHVDECGAPEKHTGCKIIAIETLNGKLTPELVRPYLIGFGFCHHSQPKVISISQTTELGTVYSPEEIKALALLAHENDMFLHVDGARIANGVVASGATLSELIVDTGVDVLSFGGTKNGLMIGEVAVFLNTELAKNFQYERKQEMQLYSKMRFVAAQFLAYLKDDLWLELAANSNNMAQYLMAQLSEIKEITVTQRVEANAVFVILPEDKREIIREKYFFYDWDESRGEVRLMCSFDTTKAHIDQFIKYIKEVL